jgi:hypothetical protein
VLEGPRVFRFAVEAVYPCRLVVVVKFFALWRRPFLDGFAVPPLNDFFVAELDPTKRKLVCVDDELCTYRHFIVTNFVLAFDELEQFLVAHGCHKKGISFLLVCRRQVARFNRSFVMTNASSFWRRKAVA